MSTFEPPPTYAMPIIEDPRTGKPLFNPIWLKWFVDFAANVTPSGAGSVTSVGLSMPSIFTVSGTPVTGAGTLTASLVSEVANLVFAGPASGTAAAPSFRALVSGDIPSLSGTYVPYTGATAAVDLNGKNLSGILQLTVGSNTSGSYATVVDAGNVKFKLLGDTASQYGKIEWYNNSGVLIGNDWLTGDASAGIRRYQLATSGSHDFITGTASISANTPQFRVSHTASNVNYFQVSGAATTGRPSILATGSDTNIGLLIQTKGNETVYFQSGAGSTNQFSITSTPSAVNWLQTNGATTGNPVGLAPVGSDTNIGYLLDTKGTGSILLKTGGTTQAQVNNTASAVNILNITGGTTGNPVVLSATGSDANINIQINNKGAGSIVLGGQAVNNLTLIPLGSGLPVLFRNPGDAGFRFETNTQNIDFCTDVSGGIPDFRVTHGASRANWLSAQGTATGVPVNLLAQGSDTNVSINLVPKGTGGVYVNSGVLNLSNASAGQIQFPATQNASSNANTLDDYEEGTWTPTFTCDTPGNLALTYSIRVGDYIKIGRFVHATFRMDTSSFTWTTASGNTQVTGFPFALSESTSNFSSALAWHGANFNYTAGYTSASIELQSGTSALITQNGTTKSNAATPISNFISTGSFLFGSSFSYMAA